jgi:hypothetical protein
MIQVSRASLPCTVYYDARVPAVNVVLNQGKHFETRKCGLIVYSIAKNSVFAIAVSIICVKTSRVSLWRMSSSFGA